jgi:hypothetical protein
MATNVIDHTRMISAKRAEVVYTAPSTAEVKN